MHPREKKQNLIPEMQMHEIEIEIPKSTKHKSTTLKHQKIK